MVTKYEEFISAGEYNFEGINDSLFLLGVLSVFDNRYQAKADGFFEEITWKQFFAIICINLCKESPTLKELTEVMGSSHQNVKQILNKLENKGFVKIIADEEAPSQVALNKKFFLAITNGLIALSEILFVISICPSSKYVVNSFQ